MLETKVVILGGKLEIEAGTNKLNVLEIWNAHFHEASFYRMHQM